MNEADIDLLQQQINSQLNNASSARIRQLEAELERLALDNHILREELERERAPKRDER